MITSKDEYLRRLHDIQNKENLKEFVALPSDEPRFVIDANTRNIFIPDEFTFLAVKNDHAAETIYFEIDRYFDTSDLSSKTCVVQFETRDEKNVIGSGFFPVQKMDIDTVPGKIIFGWEIQNDVTFLAGDVYFSVRFYSTEEIGDSIRFSYNFNTTSVSLPVKDTLNTTDKSVSIKPGEIETLTEKFRKSVEAVSAAKTVATEAIQTAQNAATSAVSDAQTTAVNAVDAKGKEAFANISAAIDPTLSLSGKAADAAKVGEAINAESERAKGVESQLKEDLGNIIIAINKRNKINPLFSKAGVRWIVNVSENRVAENSQANITALIYEVSKEDNLIITGIGNAQATMPIGCFTSAVPMPESSPVVIESIITKTSWKTETLKVKSPVDGYLLVNVLTEDIESSGVVKQTTINVAHPDNGVFVDNGVYTHFHKVGKNKYLCRVFKKCFGNNLLDFYAIYIASFSDGILTKTEDIETNSSDIVGPISIHDGDYLGSWTGGSHTVNIGGAEYPTATNDLVKVVCNTEDVTNINGYHIGNVEITSVNTLYLPKSVTGADLSNAIKAIEETRKYILSNTMIVRDSLKFLGDFYVQRYYGCQLITYDMETLELPNNMVQIAIQNRTDKPNYYFENRENSYHCFSKTGRCYDMELKPSGLGSFSLYDGSKDDLKFGYLANFFINKIYFGLIGKSILINNGKVLTWEAVYNYYFS